MAIDQPVTATAVNARKEPAVRYFPVQTVGTGKTRVERIKKVTANTPSYTPPGKAAMDEAAADLDRQQARGDYARRGSDGGRTRRDAVLEILRRKQP